MAEVFDLARHKLLLQHLRKWDFQGNSSYSWRAYKVTQPWSERKRQRSNSNHELMDSCYSDPFCYKPPHLLHTLFCTLFILVFAQPVVFTFGVICQQRFSLYFGTHENNKPIPISRSIKEAKWSAQTSI